MLAARARRQARRELAQTGALVPGVSEVVARGCGWARRAVAKLRQLRAAGHGESVPQAGRDIGGLTGLCLMHRVRHVELPGIEHAIADGIQDLRLPAAVVVVDPFVA